MARFHRLVSALTLSALDRQLISTYAIALSRSTVSTFINPNLVLYGTTVPRYFYEALLRRVLENGLTARCLIIETGEWGMAGDA
ncbi:MAG: hypothetical protein LBF34_03890 [Puniceicoccales bacterium]|nr:hypothetical protein [Puniceicoccales bacterium]